MNLNNIENTISNSQSFVFQSKEFDDQGSVNDIEQVLNDLVKRKKLLRIGIGIYAKARINALTGEVMPDFRGGAKSLLCYTLDKLCIEYTFDEWTLKYQAGETTQVPGNPQIIVKNKTALTDSLNVQGTTLEG